MKILGIESSCDETAAAVYDDNGLRSNIIASQTIHERFGGVVPELASRAHQTSIWPTVNQALEKAGVTMDEIDAIAVTNGPGLMGSLLVGLSFAKGLSLSYNKPIIGVNHIDAHIYANFIGSDQPDYPFIALVVSGGHTMLVKVDNPFEHFVLGQTRDDAAGEAFDKIGKILGLPYPAGPEMDRRARIGNPYFHDFPRALLNKGFDFSFSGLKTSVLYYLRDIPEKEKASFLDKHLNDICASVSHAITGVLVKKLDRAVRKTDIHNVLLAGGVSANSMLREKVSDMALRLKARVHIPDIAYCTDNAAMIAITGYMKARRHRYDDMHLKAYASLM